MDTIAVLEALLINLSEKDLLLQEALINGTSEEVSYAQTNLSLAVDSVVTQFTAYIKDFNKKDTLLIDNIKFLVKNQELQEIINKQANKISILQYRIESQGL
jgi:hypothetical protein